jgi:hypothetical protein
MTKITIQNPEYPFEIIYQRVLDNGQAKMLLSHFETHGLSLNRRVFACTLEEHPDEPTRVGTVVINVARGLKLHHTTRNNLPKQFAIYLDKEN